MGRNKHVDDAEDLRDQQNKYELVHDINEVLRPQGYFTRVLKYFASGKSEHEGDADPGTNEVVHDKVGEPDAEDGVDSEVEDPAESTKANEAECFLPNAHASPSFKNASSSSGVPRT